MAKLILLFLSTLALQLASSQSDGPFASSIFNRISRQKPYENVILSPFSIQTALTLLYMGADGTTADDLRNGLRYTSSNKLQNADYISQILNSKSDGQVQLKIANRIYTGTDIAPKFNEIALKYFKSEAERVNFANSRATVQKINSWVESKTDHKIQNLLTPNSIDRETSAILINAIYFKAKWETQFSNYTTKKLPFWTAPDLSYDVHTMSGEINCKYGEFPELDATAIELKYEDKDMGLLVILPNQQDGLRTLEDKLSTVDLTSLSSKMNTDEVLVKLPKFKIEFDVKLIPILEEMGMREAFTDKANYNELFKSNVPVKVSDVVHKAYIDVNENGSEAAAATYTKTVFLSSHYNPNPKIFIADHPFVFAIKNNDAVYFVGHVVRV